MFKKKKSNGEKVDIEDFYDKGSKISQDLKEFLYMKDKDGNLIFDGFISVKKKWLKIHFKNEFYQKKERKDFSISQIQYVKEGFRDWFKEFEDDLEKIKKLYEKIPINKKELENSSVGFRADMSFYLLKISSNKCFGFVRDFVENANHKNDDLKIDNLKKNIKGFGKQLEVLKEEYLPSQSLGLCIAKGSMNYYTVNKKPKEYYDGELKRLKEKQKEITAKYVKSTNILYVRNERKHTENSYKFKKMEINWLQNYSKIKDSQDNKLDLNLNEIYKLMKKFKASMKSLLYEKINEGKTLEEIKSEFYLFDSPCLEDFIGKSREIASLNKNQNFENRKRIASINKQRGRLFLNEGRKNYRDRKFMNWINFCESFKRVAVKRGKLKAQIKGTEMERIEAENNKYWVLILEKDEMKHILLIPKEEMKEAKNYLGTLKCQERRSVLYVLNSLTKRALHKLCFAEESTFTKEMKEKDFRLWQEFKEVKEATDDEDKLEKYGNLKVS